jgi:hypothetical protein
VSYTATSEENDSDGDSSAAIDRPYWLDEPCPAWCDKLHEEHLYVADRRHISSDYMREVILSTEDPVVIGEKPHDLSDYHPTELVIYLDQHVREVAPRVIIDQVPAGRRKLHFLPAEARRVGEALLRLATMAADEADESEPVE